MVILGYVCNAHVLQRKALMLQRFTSSWY